MGDGFVRRFPDGRLQGRDLPAPAMEALAGAEQYELLSLDPSREGHGSPGNFHGWKVLGRTSVADSGTRQRLNEALRAGARTSDGSMAACFIPRHGIRAVRAGKATELVICFECLSAQVYQDGRRTEGFATTGSPEKLFDEVLKAAGVELAAKGSGG